MGAADGGRVLVPGPVVPTLGDLVPKDTRQRLEAVLLVAAGWRGEVLRVSSRWRPGRVLNTPH